MVADRISHGPALPQLQPQRPLAYDELEYAAANLYSAVQLLYMALAPLVGPRPWWNVNGQVVYGVSPQERIASHEARMEALRLCVDSGLQPPISFTPAPPTTPHSRW